MAEMLSTIPIIIDVVVGLSVPAYNAYMSVIVSWEPIIGAIIIVLGSAAIRWWMDVDAKKEQRIDRERDVMNAVKGLFWGLLAMAKQGSFVDRQKHSSSQRFSFIMDPEDVSWLKRYFHENGHLIPPRLHEAYHNYIMWIDTRPMRLRSIRHEFQPYIQSGSMGANFIRLFLATREELTKLDPNTRLPDLDSVPFHV